MSRIYIYRREKTGSPKYNSNSSKPSNKNNGTPNKPALPDSPSAGAADLEATPRIYARYIRDGQKQHQHELLSNQSKSEGSDIPKPKYDRRAR